MTRQQESEGAGSYGEENVDLSRVGDRLGRQIAAITQWNRHAALVERTRQQTERSRQMREESRARLEYLRRTHDAVIERASRAIDDTVDLLMSGKPLALVVHPNAWMRGRLTSSLGERGVEVIATCPDGDEGLGIAIVEQPDLVLIDDRISSCTGLELLAEIREYSGALVAAQVADEAVMGAMLDRGAAAVFSRRVPPRGDGRGPQRPCPGPGLCTRPGALTTTAGPGCPAPIRHALHQRLCH